MTNPSTELARAVVRALVEPAGSREVVLAPGSRNAPLAFAAYDAAEAGLLRLHTRVDERTAGFLALGLTKVGSYAAVMCTSGTAVANLQPGRARGGARRRPARRRHRRPAGPAARHRRQPDHRPGRDLRSPGRDGRRGRLPPRSPTSRRARHVLHLNLQLDDPLVPDDRWHPEPVALESTRGEVVVPAVGELLEVGPRTVVVAGDDAGPPARTLAEYADWPLLAEPSSGSRTGENAIRCYRLLLDGELGRRVERVVVFGHPTLSRPVMQLLARDDVEVLDAGSRARGVWTERPFTVARRFMSGQPLLEGADDPGWLEEWRGRRRRGRPRGSTPCSPPRAPRRTASPAWSAVASRATACWSSVRRARSATST